MRQDRAGPADPRGHGAVTSPTREVEIYDHIIVVVENFIEIGRFPINEEVTKDAALRNAEMFKASEDVLEALANLVDEFGCTLDQYNRIGPDYTMRDGTEVFNVSSITDRADLIECARAAIARARGETP